MDLRDLRLIDYSIYIAASVLLTVWVGHTLHRNGRPFLVSVFNKSLSAERAVLRLNKASFKDVFTDKHSVLIEFEFSLKG